jgi:hypothetical protein
VSAYETTDVPVERSQGEIRKLLYRHKASNFAFMETTVDGCQFATIDFVVNRLQVRIRVPLKPINQRALNERIQRARTRSADQIRAEAVEQEARRIWRVMFHTLKARLVAVEEGVETFEEAFLSHLVDPVTGVTMWEAVKAPISRGALLQGGPGLMGSPLGELAAGDIVDAEVVD